MFLIDAHFHLDLYPDPVSIIDRIEELKLHVVAVTNAPSVFENTRKLTEHSSFIVPAVGLHPELVESHGKELGRLLRLIPTVNFVGEVGLDYVTSNPTHRANQRAVFENVIEECSRYPGKSLTIHSRRAVSDVLSIIGTDFPGNIILHWFTGTPRQLEKATEAGCYFSINPAMTKSKKGRVLISKMNPSRVLTESDGPFLQIAGRPAIPEDCGLAISGLADLWERSREEVAALIYSNYMNLRRSVNRSRFD